jgi:ubiquinone/menaquinone biosynthesis C-methylase UbiE
MLRANVGDHRMPGRRQMSLVQGDVRDVPFATRSFDYVLSTRVLSHLSTPSLVFCEFSRVAKVGARLLITDVHPSIPIDTYQFQHMIESLQ